MVSEHASPLACVGGVDAGGQNVHVGELARALAGRGHSVVVYTRANRPDLPRRVSFCPGVQVEHVVAGPEAEIEKDQLLPHMAAFAAQLTRRWERSRPDLVHAHFWMSGLAATQAAGVLDLPVVQTFHALGTVKRRWQADADTSPPSRIGTERRVAHVVDRVIATCTDEVRELSKLGVPRARIDVVPCGVDIEHFHPAAAANPGPEATRRRRLIALGRLVPRKGIDDAIRALAKIPEVELMIVGGPAPEHIDFDPEVRRLRAVAVQFGVGERVLFTGRIERDQLPAVLCTGDALLAVPWYEPFGIAPLEAMACGLPVVATAVGGMLDTVVHGTTGLLVEPGAVEGLAEAVRGLLVDDERRRQMAQACVQRVRELYTWPAVAGRTEHTYESVVASRRRFDQVVEASR
jgi:glycosyltransferase involved in cell wall biosynthesis